jgi:Na+/alanine symporter
MAPFRADQMADGGTLLCLYPLALFCAATAIVALRTGVLPRWLGAGAAVTAAALAVNGAFLEASFVPALLLFLAWTLVASVYLVRRSSREPARVSREAITAASTSM